jgi:hypothetical protein
VVARFAVVPVTAPVPVVPAALTARPVEGAVPAETFEQSVEDVQIEFAVESKFAYTPTVTEPDAGIARFEPSENEFVFADGVEIGVPIVAPVAIFLSVRFCK